MIQYTAADLEHILRLAGAKAQSEGIDPKKYATIFHEAVHDYETREQKPAPTPPVGDRTSLYQRVSGFPWYICSFQMSRKKNGTHDAIYPSSNFDNRWGEIQSKVNTRFPGYNLTDSNRGHGNIFVWLSSHGSETILESYGNAHSDGERRFNMHYFGVVGDSAVLQNVLQSFQKPSYFNEFVGTCFQWQNKRGLRDMGRGEPDLMHPYCNELLLSSKPGEVRSVPVAKQ